MFTNKTAYAKKLLDPRWQRKRLEIMQRDDFACRDCSGRNATLHVHHNYYTYGKQPWEYPDSALVTLCDGCHEKRHGRNRPSESLTPPNRMPNIVDAQVNEDSDTLQSAGRYHFIVNVSHYCTDKSGDLHVRFEFESLIGGRVLRNQEFPVASPKLLGIAKALHLSNWLTGKQFDAKDATGYQLFANVIHSQGSLHIGEEIYSIADERANEFPRNQEMIDFALSELKEKTAE